MKVTHVKTRIISTPADNPLVVGIPVGNATREFVTLEMGTDAGVEGIGLTFFGGPLTVALRDAVEALGALVIGENPLQVEAIAAKLRQAASQLLILPCGTSRARRSDSRCTRCLEAIATVLRHTPAVL
jgi:L-alanine-DL-glutamate epimerase-like enolase superfamily enzyme